MKRLLSLLVCLAWAIPASAQLAPVGPGVNVPAAGCYQINNDSFMCRSIAGTFTIGSTKNGTDGTLKGGTQQVGDGSGGAPSLTFTSATTTGFWRDSNAGIDWTIAGVTKGTLYNGGIQLNFDGLLGWSSGTVGIAAADVTLFRDAANTIAQRNGANAQLFRLYQTTTGPVANTLDATAPTISSGFGSTPSIVAGSTALSMRVNVGTGGAATSGVIGVPTATTGWNCQVTDMTTNVATRQSASTTNTITFTAASAWTASDILVATCIAY